MNRRAFLLGSIAAGVIRMPRRAFASGFAEVGGGSQRATIRAANVGSAPAAFPADVTAGDLLLVCIGAWMGGTGFTSLNVTDTLSTSYSVLIAPTGVVWAGGTGRGCIAYGIAPSSGPCTVTVDPVENGQGNSWINAVIDEFSGVNATPLDVDGGESTGSNTTPSDSLTTVTDNDLVVGVLVDVGSGGTITPDAAFTELDEDETGARQPYSAIFQIVGAAGSYSPNWTLSVSQAWSVYTAAFKPAAAPDVPTQRLRSIGR